MNVNKVMLTGRLTADPETRNTPSGQTVSTVRLATNRTWNDASGNKQEHTEFHTIVVWGKLAEICQKYLQKGQLAFFEGRLQTRQWQDQAGAKRYTTEVVAENMQMGPRATGSSGMSSAPYSPTANRSTPINQSRPSSPTAGPKDDDIPVINEDYPVSDPMKPTGDIEEAEIDLKDIPF